jgi:AraC-like DNA-binding protein
MLVSSGVTGRRRPKNRNSEARGFMDRALTVDSVRERVTSLLTEGYPTIDRVAAALSVSARTLQRRLQDDGVSYGQLIDDIRLQTARQLLEGSELPLRDVASKLGYADPGSFSRFFLRRMGKTPRTYRQECRRMRPTRR